MSWTDHALWWHVYPLGFTGAPIRPAGDSDRAPAHRLRRLLPWLDHLLGLGCNGLLLGPVFASGTHGYDTTDHLRIDPRLGDDSDFDALVAACRERGVRLVLDGVFNHVGDTHPAYRAALADAAAPSNALFRLDRSSGTPRPSVFEGHGSLVALDHTSDATVAFVTDVMLHWLRRGIDGWRLDAAYAVPAAFWERVLPRVRLEFPDAWIVGEMIHGDYAAYVSESGLDSVTQYELWKATWSSLADANFFELDHALGRHNDLLDHFVPQTFIGNHDVTRIATRVGPDRALLAAVVLFTVGGIPSVYAGDEDGFTGTKRDMVGGDDEVRPEFPAAPAELSGLGEGLRHAYQGLLSVRRRHPWLVRARTTALELSNTRYTYEASGGAGERLRVELDAEAATARVVGADGDLLWAAPGPA